MKRFLKNIIRKSGLDVHYLSPTSNLPLQLLKGLKKFKVDLVLDIGANIGQFAIELRDIGYLDRIVSFEPLTEAHAQLKRAASKDKKWEIHHRGAIGETDDVIVINIAGNSVSSSTLPMLDAHRIAALDSAYISSEITPIQTLDVVAQDYITESSNVFIKIDTQGSEWQVLNGGRETLKRVCGVMLELSLVPLYDGQRLWSEIIDRLNSEGFTLWAIQNGFTNPINGRTLQIDAIFFRDNDT